MAYVQVVVETGRPTEYPEFVDRESHRKEEHSGSSGKFKEVPGDDIGLRGCPE